jgi:hypothetical protein
LWGDDEEEEEVRNNESFVIALFHPHKGVNAQSERRECSLGGRALNQFTSNLMFSDTWFRCIFHHMCHGYCPQRI